MTRKRKSGIALIASAIAGTVAAVVRKRRKGPKPA